MGKLNPEGAFCLFREMAVFPNAGHKAALGSAEPPEAQGTVCGPLSFPRAWGGGGPALWTDPGCSGHSTYSALRCPPAALHPLPTPVLTQPEPLLSSPCPALFPLPSPHFSSLTGATEMARRPNRVSESSQVPIP